MTIHKFNFDRKNTRARALKALAFVITEVDEVNETPVHCKRIEKYLSRSNKPIGDMLRQMLLETVQHKYSWGKKAQVKKYIQNAKGITDLQKLLFGDAVPSKAQLQAQSADLIFDDYHNELVTGNFVYDFKSDRNFHSLMYMRSELRRPAFARCGYNHVYDIEAAAPMALICSALQCNIKPLSISDAQPILDYISNRNILRLELSQHTGLDADVIKRIVTAVFTGAHISKWQHSDIFKLVGCDENKILLLNSHAKIIALKASIKLMWQSLRAEYDVFHNYLIPRSTVTCMKTGKQKLKRISSRDKSDFYRKCELEIMNTIEQYHKLYCGAKMFREHDGWSSDTKVNLVDLVAYVQQKTIYDRIQIDYEYVQ